MNALQLEGFRSTKVNLECHAILFVLNYLGFSFNFAAIFFSFFSFSVWLREFFGGFEIYTKVDEVMYFE